MTTEVTLAGDFGKPASTLIDRISDAIGGIARPWQIKRVADAEAQAEIARTEARLQISDLERRAMERLFREEAKKQENIESITAQAIPLLTDDSEPSKLEDDWITNFFDNCRSVSSEEMQAIWARLLASEANSAGSVAKRTIDVLASLDRSDAELFSKITQFSLDDDNRLIAIYRREDSIYSASGFDFAGLTHLADLGLLQCDFLAGFVGNQPQEKVDVNYHGRVVRLTLPGPPYQLSIGNIRLTAAGAQIIRMLPKLYNDKFLDYLLGVWAEKNYDPQEIKLSDFVTVRP
jgi:hypothetical protein